MYNQVYKFCNYTCSFYLKFYQIFRNFPVITRIKRSIYLGISFPTNSSFGIFSFGKNALSLQPIVSLTQYSFCEIVQYTYKKINVLSFKVITSLIGITQVLVDDKAHGTIFTCHQGIRVINQGFWEFHLPLKHLMVIYGSRFKLDNNLKCEIYD